MKKYKILYYDNKVGLRTDAFLLYELLTVYGLNCELISLSDLPVINHSDIGIWTQDFDDNLLEKFKINIFYINEEWYCRDLESLKKFDVVLCKNTFALNLLSSNSNVICLPFFSKNLNMPSNQNNKILHFAGRSIQKNTEVTIPNVNNLTILDPDNNWSHLKNNKYTYNHITTYVSNYKLKTILNSHKIHICCSLYESWGHYLFEGLSTGSEIICSDIPVFRENLDPDLVHFLPTYEHDITDKYKYKSDIYPLRKSFFINKNDLINTINDFEEKGSNEKRKRLFKFIIDKNKKNTLNFFKKL